MNIGMLQNFFLWCTVMGIGLMIFTTVMYRIMPGTVYKSQKIFFPEIKKETVEMVIYGFLGIFKIMILVFFAIPYIALLIIG